MYTDTNKISFDKPVDVIFLRELLEDKGIDHEHAEAIAIAIDLKVRSQDTTGFATKEDIKDLRNDINALRLSTNGDIEALRQATKGDIQALKTELELKIENTKLSIIIWVLGGTFAINQLPNLFNWIAKLAAQ